MSGLGTEAKGRVLIVDDQFLIVEFLRIWVETYGFEVCGTAKNAKEAVDQALKLKPDYILMDMRLEGDQDGVDAALAIAPHHTCRIIYVTGSSEKSTIARINEDHPFSVLIKPIDPAELGRVLHAP
jgi:DNA-binding NarL/FixJ family response regulator